MPARRLRFRPAVSAIALLLAVFGAQQAHAGLFDDEEARRQVNDLSIKLNERVDTLSKAQIELMNQIQSDKAGVIKSILVNNGETVEFDQPLFIIE